MAVDESGAWMDVEDDRCGGVNFEALVAVARAASPPRTRLPTFAALNKFIVHSCLCPQRRGCG